MPKGYHWGAGATGRQYIMSEVAPFGRGSSQGKPLGTITGQCVEYPMALDLRAYVCKNK